MPDPPQVTESRGSLPARAQSAVQVSTGSIYFSIEQLTREQVLSDINNLVNQQLVSSVLRSNFRSRLEEGIRDRLRRSGTDGERTRANLLQANIAQVPRNDFSRLGIDGNVQQTRGLPWPSRERQTFASARELIELRSDITDLNNLLKVSFELQVDTQRAFKQEISALMASTFANSASARLISSARVCQEGQCVICTETQVDSVFYMCGHMCACFVCSMSLKQKGHNCPVCRAPIVDIVRVYKTNLE